MKIRILMITHNRPAYTRRALRRLCDTSPESARITIWDNGSSRETASILDSFESHPAIDRIVFSKVNAKLWGPTNWFWKNTTDAEYLAKVDDDGLMPSGWIETLERAHRDIPEAGILATWRFLDEDFLEDAAQKKIQTFGGHKILRNCWVQGSGYLMKRSVIEKLGVLREGETFTTYCIRAAAAGYLNGWYFPFLYHEHMDDPRSQYSELRNEAEFLENRPLTAQAFGIRTLKEWSALNKWFAFNAQTCSFDPNDWIGLRPWISQRLHNVLGLRYNPRVRIAQ